MSAVASRVLALGLQDNVLHWRGAFWCRDCPVLPTDLAWPLLTQLLVDFGAYQRGATATFSLIDRRGVVSGSNRTRADVRSRTALKMYIPTVPSPPPPLCSRLTML
jgi:hypothetical protein